MKRSSPPLGGISVTMQMGAVEWALLLLLSLLWGGSFFFVEIAVRELPTFSIVALRVGIAALVLWGVVAALGLPVPRGRATWSAFLVMGILNNAVPFGLFVWGQQTISSSLASILNATTPLFTVVVAGLLLADERVTAPKVIGVLVGFAGAVAVIGPGAFAAVETYLWAQLACLGAALSYAFAGVFGRRFRRLGVDPVVVAAGQVTMSTLLLMPLAAVADRPWTLAAPSPAVWLAVLGLAVLSTAAAYVLYFQLLSRAGATNLSVVTFLIPVSAIGLALLFLGESLHAADMAGMVMIGIGLLAIDGRILRWFRPEARRRRV